MLNLKPLGSTILLYLKRSPSSARFNYTKPFSMIIGRSLFAVRHLRSSIIFALLGDAEAAYYNTSSKYTSIVIKEKTYDWAVRYLYLCKKFPQYIPPRSGVCKATADAAVKNATTRTTTLLRTSWLNGTFTTSAREKPQQRTLDALELDLRLTRDTAMFIRSGKSRIKFQAHRLCTINIISFIKEASM